MTPDEKYMKAIADCNKHINEVERKLDAFSAWSTTTA